MILHLDPSVRILKIFFMQDVNAKIRFASGSALYESAPNVLRTDSSLSVSQSMLVQGSVASFGRNLVSIA